MKNLSFKKLRQFYISLNWKNVSTLETRTNNDQNDDNNDHDDIIVEKILKKKKKWRTENGNVQLNSDKIFIQYFNTRPENFEYPPDGITLTLCLRCECITQQTNLPVHFSEHSKKRETSRLNKSPVSLFNYI